VLKIILGLLTITFDAMTRPRKTPIEKIRAAVRKYGAQVFRLEHSASGYNLFCRVCGKIVNHNDVARIAQHVDSNAHKAAVSAPIAVDSDSEVNGASGKRSKYEPISSALSDTAAAERELNAFRTELFFKVCQSQQSKDTSLLLTNSACLSSPLL
jgi:hypothetical protein